MRVHKDMLQPVDENKFKHLLIGDLSLLDRGCAGLTWVIFFLLIMTSWESYADGESTESSSVGETQSSTQRTASVSNAREDDEDDDEDDEDDWDDEDDGEDEFEDLDHLQINTSQLPPPPSALRIDGIARSQWAMWTQRDLAESWAKARQNLDLRLKYKRSGWFLKAEGHLEYDLIYDVSSQEFDSTQVEEYRARYIRGIQVVGKSFSVGGISMTLSSGRQVVTWGEADGASALDVINPQDQREPGVSDIDDLRIAVWLSRLEGTWERHSLEFIVRHEGYYGLLVPPRADYSPFNSLLASEPGVARLLEGKTLRFAHEHEGVSRDTQSYFLRYLYRGEGLDLGLYGASLLDLQGVLGEVDLNQFLDPTQTDLALTYLHPRYHIVGGTFALPIASFLLKGEVVGALGRSVNLGESTNPATLTIEKANLLTGVVGITYSGWTDTTIGAEYQRGALIGDEPNQPFFFPPNIDLVVLRFNTTQLREKLTLGAVLSLIQPRWSEPARLHEPKRGGLIRLDATYRLLDQLKLGLGYIHYLQSDAFGPFYGLEKHDRVFTQLRWDFTVY